MKKFIATLSLLFVASAVSDFLVKEGLTNSMLLRFAALPVRALAAEAVPVKATDIRELIPERQARYRYFYQVRDIIIHHDEIYSRDFSNEPLAAISRYHLQKWSSVGYHYYIARSGTIYYLNDVSRITPHCRNHNQKSIGICLHGNFDKEQPTGSQYAALNHLISKLKLQYPVRGVHLHSDYRNTRCPGRYFDRTRITDTKASETWTLIPRIKAFLSRFATGNN